MSGSAAEYRSDTSHKTHAVKVGGLVIGGGAPIAVQSMTKTRTENVTATVRQIGRLAKAGCELVRVAVPDRRAADSLPEIRKRVDVPLCADIHFDYQLALCAIRAGFDKVRINPGNIGPAWKTKEIIQCAADHRVAIRLGVNAGSLEKKLLARYGRPSAEALAASLEHSLEPFEQLRFRQVVLSAKTTSLRDTIEVYRRLARKFKYPLHLGLTEAGLPLAGAIRSAAALSVLLLAGIGDTIRISLTGDPVLEVEAAYELLAALGLRQRGPAVYSCPGCGRTQIDIVRLARRVKAALRGMNAPIKVAVMGCVVNGPGEAREADFGIAGGRGRGAVFARGKVVKTCREERLVEELMHHIKLRAGA